jgi:hypothetical protein
MTTRELLIEEIEKTPEPVLQEVYDFLRFLRKKSDEDAFDGLVLSESALARDWLCREEDDAWKDL